MDNWKNQLFFGDNLEILQSGRIPIESVDLIYLDPPFNSSATYNVLFAEKTGEKSAAQITAFEDTWHWGQEAAGAYDDVMKHGPRKLADLLQALRSFLGGNDMMAYLAMMAVRLVELHRVLKPTGSLYLHCDPTASHYLKLLLDAIFGHINFRNELIWKRTSAHSSAKRYGPVHDVIFFYTKSLKYKWYPQFTRYDEEYLNQFYRFMEKGRRFRLSDLTGAGVRRGETGKVWRGVDVTKRGRHWMVPPEELDKLDSKGRIFWPEKGVMPCYKRYLDEMPGVSLQDVLSDIQPVVGKKERLGYPTQKPEALLERIILASSKEGDLVLDPFCGCGTTVTVAERLKRRWLGIDLTHLAITLIKERLHNTFKEDRSPYVVIGEPADVTSAAALAEANRHQFEWWVLGLVNATPAQDKKKGADRGVDGVIYFKDDAGGQYKKIIVQVKSGGVKSGDVRDLKGVLDRDKAQIGAFLTLKPPTKAMREEAAAADFYAPPDFPDRRFPRLQILTIAELLGGKKLDYPQWAVDETFKKAARRYKETDLKQNDLL